MRLSRLPSLLSRVMSTGTKPVAPRPSASLVVINERDEVLLVHRNHTASTFAGVHVFPGGNYDGQQDASLPMTAIRETFEESGVLLASPQSGNNLNLDDIPLEEERRAIHSQTKTFTAFLEQYKLEPDLGLLLPFTEWITPVEAPRRFHARFYVTFLPSSSAVGFSSGQKTEQIPTPDGGKEVISARFLTPSAWLSLFNERKITFMPPQYYILHTLAGIPVELLREQVQRLSKGGFGKMVFNPRKLWQDGAVGVLTYEGDETRGGKNGRHHRAKCEFAKGGITTKIELQRNFDIFTDVEDLSLGGAKL